MKRIQIKESEKNRIRGLHNIVKDTINEQGQSSCVASDCFMDMTFSSGNQYGGTVSLEGCGVGTYTIYLNNSMQSQGQTYLGQSNYSTNVGWGNISTPIIRIKAVLECTHPSSSPQNVTKTICVQRTTGNIIPCSKRIPTEKAPLDKASMSRDMEEPLKEQTEPMNEWMFNSMKTLLKNTEEILKILTTPSKPWNK